MTGAEGRSDARFQAVQRSFAGWIRNPGRTPLPAGVDGRRMRVYADLFRRNVDSLLAGMLPGFRRSVDDGAWDALIGGFLSDHRARTPLFRRVAEEFLDYLGGDAAPASTPPWALELCHFEWLALDLDLAPDADCAFGGEPAGLDDVLVLSPLARPLRYDWPVDRIGADGPPAARPDQPTWLLACRNRRHEVRFMASNAVTVRLVNLIAEGAMPRAAVAAVARELGRPPPAMLEAGARIVARLHADDVLARPAPPAPALK